MGLFLIGLVPIVVFLILLTFLKKSAMFSAYASLVVAIILNFVMPGWRMPVQGVIASIIEGFATAWMPIGFVVFAALFAYDLSVKTGKIETIKSMLGSISTDKRAQALILAWGFGGFIEGIAGYGTAVAIPAAIMVSLGFNPLNAALICLIANSTPTAFGTVGLPVTTMISNFGLNAQQTALFTSLLLLLLTCVIPFILVVFANKEIDGGKNPAFGKGILPVVIASIIGYMIQPLIAMTTGAELPTIISSLIAMILMIIATKMFVKAEEGFETVADLESFLKNRNRHARYAESMKFYYGGELITTTPVDMRKMTDVLLEAEKQSIKAIGEAAGFDNITSDEK